MFIDKVAVLTGFVAILASGGARADASDELQRMEGYTIVLTTRIAGYVDEGGKRQDSFEGCDFDRVIIFDNDRVLKCATYSYTYSYHPSAIIFVKDNNYKMLVGDRLYDMRR